MPERTEIQSTVEQTSKAISLYDKIHLGMISLVHDTLYRLFVNPYPRLTGAGLRPGQVVLEVGCGPGFFTIPAAEIIGMRGHLYTLDINPAAVEHVKQRVEGKGLTNIDVMHAAAAKTGLPDASIDVTFLFGVLHSLKDLDAVLLEMHRVLNEGGVLAVQKSSWSESHLLDRFTKGGLFRFAGTDAGIYTFSKQPGYCNREESHEMNHARRIRSDWEVK